MEIQQEKIYMDALNFGDYFFNSKDLWDLNFLKRKVQDFLNALKRMKKYYLEIFLDGNNISLQCDEDYKKRVEERMIKQENKWPNGCNVLLSDAFKQHGIKVHWSLEADCDDTIATFAFYDKASILSSDKDFLCYFVDFKIYSKFEIEKGNFITFKRQTRRTKDNKPQWKLGEIKRKILKSKPKTEPNVTVETILGLDRNHLLVGYPNSIPYFSINPFKKIKELRQAIYYHWGIKNLVKEEMPEWNIMTKNVEWTIDLIDPSLYNEFFIDLLANPEKALRFYEDNYTFDKTVYKEINKLQWSNYLNGFFSIILYLCSLYNNESLLKLLINYESLAKEYLNKMFN